MDQISVYAVMAGWADTWANIMPIYSSKISVIGFFGTLRSVLPTCRRCPANVLLMPVFDRSGGSIFSVS